MYIQIDGNPTVLNAIKFLIPQLEEALSPWNIKVINVIEDIPTLSNDEIEWEDTKPSIDEIEWEEEVDNKNNLELLKKRFLSLTTYGLHDKGVERNNSVKNISIIKASDTSYAIEVQMKHEMSTEQVKSFVKFVCKDEPYKVFPGYKLIQSPDDISSEKTEDKRFFVITIKYDTVKHETPTPTTTYPIPKIRRITL